MCWDKSIHFLIIVNNTDILEYNFRLWEKYRQKSYFFLFNKDEFLNLYAMYIRYVN